MIDTRCTGGQEVVVHHLSEGLRSKSFLSKLCSRLMIILEVWCLWRKATKVNVTFIPRPLRTNDISFPLSCSGFGIKVTTMSVPLSFGHGLSNDKLHYFSFHFPVFPTGL